MKRIFHKINRALCKLLEALTFGLLKCKKKHHSKEPKRGAGISLLVPFRSDKGHRAEIWKWLEEYYRHELPGAEIVVSNDDEDPTQPFSKTLAFNMAAAKAKGDIFVLLDADCYIPGSVIIKAAEQIREFESRGVPLWFIPYRHFYRLGQLISADLLASDPKNPMRFHGKLDESVLDEMSGISHGHHFGALIQIMSRNAWETVGGMDTRFRGWGSEDICFLKAMDTLYSKHKTIDASVYHVWHSKIKTSVNGLRMWDNQIKAGQNSTLADRYNRAHNDPKIMRDLVEEDPWRSE